MSELETQSQAPAAAPAPVINEAAALAILNNERPAPEPARTEPVAGAEASVDPLDPELYTDEKLSTPAALVEAAKRIRDEIAKANDLKRKVNRAHGAAEVRERKVKAREEHVGQRETRSSAIDRMQAQAIEDFESGDTTRFLTAVGKLSKTGDPVGFWRNAAIALAKGEAFKPEEKAAIAADPEPSAVFTRRPH
jgi:hypothetical protein